MITSRIAPSVVLPGLLVPQLQTTNFEKYIGQKTNYGGMAEEMLYITTINHINSETSVGQQWAQELTKQSYSLGQIGLPFYRLNAYVEYDENERAKFEELSNGVSLPVFLENLAKQGLNQRKHQGILFGFDTTKEQGILSNATIATLPADSNAKQTLTEYNTFELQQFLSKLIRDVMDSTYGMVEPVVFASSTRVINYIKSAIIPVGNYLEAGGIGTVGEVFDRSVTEWLGAGKIQFVTDSLLQGIANDGKTDKVVIIATGLKGQDETVTEDTNENLVGQHNSITYNTMYDAGEGLKRMQRPDDFGIYSTLYTYKMTPGYTLRKEAVITCDIPYN